MQVAAANPDRGDVEERLVRAPFTQLERLNASVPRPVQEQCFVHPWSPSQSPRALIERASFEPRLLARHLSDGCEGIAAKPAPRSDWQTHRPAAASRRVAATKAAVPIVQAAARPGRRPEAIRHPSAPRRGAREARPQGPRTRRPSPSLRPLPALGPSRLAAKARARPAPPVLQDARADAIRRHGTNRPAQWRSR